MISILCNENWINPQIDFLLMLQNIRIAHFQMLDNLFLSLTAFGEIWIPALLCSLIYWCVDTKSGIYMFFCFGIDFISTQFCKMAAGVYRPWILNPEVSPVKSAIPYSAGYSFPSGHSATSAATYGGIAYLLRKKYAVCSLLILFVLLIGFSRLWVGVHTPQDVFFGLLLGIIVIFSVNCLVNWLEKDRKRYIYFLIFAGTLAVLSLIYLCFFNNYPITYISGHLLVNPASSIHTTVICYGSSLGLLSGICLCRRFFPFEAKSATFYTKLIRGLAGIACAYPLLNNCMEYCFANVSDLKTAFLFSFFIGLFVTALYPLIFQSFEKLIGNLNKTGLN